MKRLFLLGLLGTLGVSLAFISGCGDDQKAFQPEPGNPADSAFFTDFVGNQALNSADWAMLATMGLLQHIPPPTAPSKEGSSQVVLGMQQENAIIQFDTVNHSFSGDWHVFYFVFTVTEDGGMVTIRGTDSIIIWDNNAPLLYPMGEADSLEARSHVDVDASYLQGAFEASGHGDHTLNVIGNPFDTIAPVLTIDASIDDSLHSVFGNDTVGTCHLIVLSASDINNIVVDSSVMFGNDCPPSGSMSVTTSVDLDCSEGSVFDSLSVNGVWTLHVTFHGETMTASFSNGLSVWTITDTCGSGTEGAGSRLSWLDLKK
jgi:hypothetical protein